MYAFFDDQIGLGRDFVIEGHTDCGDYSSDPYYIYRNGRKGQYGIVGSSAYYSDRLYSEDPDAYKRACEASQFSPTFHNQITAQQAKTWLTTFFGKKIKPLGVAVGHNKSTGYQYTIFFIKK